MAKRPESPLWAIVVAVFIAYALFSAFTAFIINESVQAYGVASHFTEVWGLVIAFTMVWRLASPFKN